MTEENGRETQFRERIFTAACIALALAGAGWFYFSSGGGAEVTLVHNPAGVALNNENESGEDNRGKIMAHVTGNVNNPGVYELPYGSRVKDALDAAGGAASGANADALNLVEVLTDGQKIVVPPKAVPAAAGFFTQISGGGGAADGGLVNINTADEKTLDGLPGIGPSYARRIIEYRAQKPFTSVEELKNISGIGPRKFEQLKDKVTVH